MAGKTDDKRKLTAELDALITNVHNAENTTRADLGTFSRKFLPYCMQYGDINRLNRMVDGLSPRHKNVARKFFKKFLPWEYDDTANRWGAKFAKDDKRIEKCKKAINEFLSKPTNTIWTFDEQEKKNNPKKADPQGKLTRALKKGVEAEGDDKLTPKMVAAAILAAGMDLSELMEILDVLAD